MWDRRRSFGKPRIFASQQWPKIKMGIDMYLYWCTIELCGMQAIARPVEIMPGISLFAQFHRLGQPAVGGNHTSPHPTRAHHVHD